MDNNKKYFKFIDNLRNYKDMMKPKYKHMFDVVAQLYTSRKIEKKITVEKLLNKLVSRGKAPLSAMKDIEKYHSNVNGEAEGSFMGGLFSADASFSSI